MGASSSLRKQKSRTRLSFLSFLRFPPPAVLGAICLLRWLAFAKLGVKCAMINHQIKQKGLVHCIKVQAPGRVVPLGGGELCLAGARCHPDSGGRGVRRRRV